MKIEIYGKKGCVFCDKAKNIYPNYTYYDIADENLKKELFIRYPNAKTVPQIFINDIHIGGFEEYRNYLIANGSENII